MQNKYLVELIIPIMAWTFSERFFFFVYIFECFNSHRPILACKLISYSSLVRKWSHFTSVTVLCFDDTLLTATLKCSNCFGLPDTLMFLSAISNSATSIFMWNWCEILAWIILYESEPSLISVKLNHKLCLKCCLWLEGQYQFITTWACYSLFWPQFLPNSCKQEATTGMRTRWTHLKASLCFLIALPACLFVHVSKSTCYNLNILYRDYLFIHFLYVLYEA